MQLFRRHGTTRPPAITVLVVNTTGQQYPTIIPAPWWRRKYIQRIASHRAFAPPFTAVEITAARHLMNIPMECHFKSSPGDVVNKTNYSSDNSNLHGKGFYPSGC